MKTVLKSRFLTTIVLMVGVCLVLDVCEASAQFSKEQSSATATNDTVGSVEGVVTDEHGEVVEDVVVSALGVTTVFAVSNKDGEFSFKDLPPGQYLVRTHNQNYLSARSLLVQVPTLSQTKVSLRLMKSETPQVLAAGLGTQDLSLPLVDDSEPKPVEDDHSELAWRLRHLKRSALKGVDAGIQLIDHDKSVFVDSLDVLSRAVSGSAKHAMALFSELPLSGQLDLLTGSSFNDQTERILSGPATSPLGVAYLSLEAPIAKGEWSVQGALTQGDLSSLLLASSYVSSASKAHQYKAGLSYTMQRYIGGNISALSSVADGQRNAGRIYAYDSWQATQKLNLSYGAEYARYGYLDSGGLFSPRVEVSFNVVPQLQIRALASRREIAPGAEEFQPPSGMNIWLPPERTFAPLSSTGEFKPERLQHYEASVEHEIKPGTIIGFRAFHQNISDQIVTLFGVATSQGTANIGHYYVASAGDLQAQGWEVSLSRALNEHLRGTIHYTQARTNFGNASQDWPVLLIPTTSDKVQNHDRLHDVTTSMEADIAQTDTRVMVVYSFITNSQSLLKTTKTRFDVQVHQALPFLNFTNANWEMLLALRNFFRETLAEASVYDELLVTNPPKRIIGGLTVRF